ncbi:hypothetical protein [Pseudarthrobacter sp. S9]|uniref:hypothetical protein n=1 Tax=Pseudarthrobacter sp. S9 TaxID=3418421 RepID=UPI003CFE3615
MTATTTEARTTVTETSSIEGALRSGRRRARLFLGLLGATVMVTSGCSSRDQNQIRAASPSGTTPFAWFQAGPAPAGWRLMALPAGTAVLPIPPDASPVDGDPGSVSAEMTAANGALQIYLNATPKQGEESQANWPQFRLDHLTGENAASATLLSNRAGMPFRGGTGSCVADSYVTRIDAHRYREIACLIAGTRGSSVLVVASPAESWDLYSPLLEQAVDSYLAE